MESKEGMMHKLRRFFSGSPKQETAQSAPAPAAAVKPAPAPAAAAPAPAEPQMSPAEMVQEQARFLCPDAWLANKITVTAEVRNGKTYLVGSPAEAAPYIKAGYAAKKDRLPADVLLA